MPDTLVVISYYEARPVEPLTALLESMGRLPAGASFRVCLVVNEGGGPRLSPPRAGFPLEVLRRSNTGMNIGAWDAGWRAHPGFERYLFLQDECLVVREGWLAAFEEVLRDPSVGMAGESLNERWDRPWDVLRREQAGVRMPEHLLEGREANRVDVYLDFLRRRSIDPGPTGRHLRALVWCLPRRVLEAVGGFPAGADFGECIAAEIGVSRSVESRGWSLRQVHPSPFRYIRHAEWEMGPSGAVSKRRAGESG